MTTAIKPTIQRFTAKQPEMLHPNAEGWWVRWKDAVAEIERLQAPEAGREDDPNAEKHGHRYIVSFVVHGNGEQYSIITRGKTRLLCITAKIMGEQLHKLVQNGTWPNWEVAGLESRRIKKREPAKKPKRA